MLDFHDRKELEIWMAISALNGKAGPLPGSSGEGSEPRATCNDDCLAIEGAASQ